MSCLFHGNEDCPAREELNSLDGQIFKRFEVENERNSLKQQLKEQCAITARLVEVNTRLRAALTTLRVAVLDEKNRKPEGNRLATVDDALKQARQVILETEIPA